MGLKTSVVVATLLAYGLVGTESLIGVQRQPFERVDRDENGSDGGVDLVGVVADLEAATSEVSRKGGRFYL